MFSPGTCSRTARNRRNKRFIIVSWYGIRNTETTATVNHSG